jgi:hypothetical protein
MPHILQMNGALRSALGKLSHYLLSKGQKDEECDARDDAMKNYSWYQKDIFYLSKCNNSAPLRSLYFLS